MASYDIGKDKAVEWIRNHIPIDAKILDVGASDGKWAKLLPEYKNIDGVEVWKPYIEQNKLHSIYKHLYEKDIREFKYSHYDLVIFGDVLEHMSVKDAWEVLGYARMHSDSNIVALPFLYPQGEANGNPYEIHVQDDLTEELVKDRYPWLKPLSIYNNYAYYTWTKGLKIYLAVPTFESIFPDTFKSIYDMDKCGNEVIFDFVRGYDCAAARNMIAENAINLKADYVMMVDNDTVLAKDTLSLLLDEPVDVCLGLCARRSIAGTYDGLSNVNKIGEYNYTKEYMYKADEIKQLRAEGKKKVQIHGGGLGLGFIKTSVFQKMNYPYFQWVTYPNKSVLSEDLFFCEQCNGLNIPVYMDVRVECGHIFRHIQNL